MRYSVFAYVDDSVLKAEMEELSIVTIGSEPDHTFYFPDLEQAYEGDLTGMRHGNHLALSMDPKVSLVVFEQQVHLANTIVLNPAIKYSIGRLPDNLFVFPNMQTSSKHALLFSSESGWMIEDLRSKNGTFKNGQKIEQSLLQNNDIIHIAGWELIFFGGAVAFISTPEMPVLNFKPVYAKMIKRINYPVFSRSPRVKTQPIEETIDFETPQYKQELAKTSLLDSVLPTAVMSVLNPMSLAYAVPNILISGKNRAKQKKTFDKKEKNRVSQYNNYLNELDEELDEKYFAQSELFHSVNPSPDVCAAIAQKRQARLWERNYFDSDYLCVRLGLGEVESGLNIRVPKVGLSAAADELMKRPKVFQEKFTYIHNAPLTLDLKEGITVGLVGDRNSMINCAQNMIHNISVHHPYDEVKLVFLYNMQEATEWEWARWLPHTWNDDKSVCFIATDKLEAKELLGEFSEILKQRQSEIDETDKYNVVTKLPYYVFVIADRSLSESHIIMRQLLKNDPYLGAISLLLNDDKTLLPNSCRTIVECFPTQTVFYNREDYSAKKECTPDCVNLEMLERTARSLAALRLKRLASESSLPSCVTFLQGMGVKKCDELNVLERWKKSAPFKELAAPIGIKQSGDPFIFDLHDKQYGPHGLVAGTTGYGKSELLQTWLLSMALNYRPDEVSFVLIDFKGDGLAGPLELLPHVAGKISNIDVSCITRNLIALDAELKRRQIVFSEAKIKDIYKYQQAYRDGKVPEQMSHLIIVIDEFAQMKKDYPDYMSSFISVARVGRSLGVHLVLATQSPSGVVDQQVLSNTRFKICLKTANVGESREMLGKSDAANLTTKGRAIIQVGNDEVYEQIQTFWSGAPYNPDQEFVKSSKKITLVGPFGQRVKPDVYEKTVIVKKSGQEEFNIIVEYIAKEARDARILPARKLWEDALPGTIYLKDLLVDRAAFNEGVFTERNTGFAPILGMVDAPDMQKQYPLEADIAGEGHTVFYGAPGTGKTTLLQTLIVSTALMYTPEQVSIYVMDFGSWSMKVLETLPHVGGVANGNDTEKIEKLAEMIEGELIARKYAFSAEGVGNIETYRDVTNKKLPYIALIVDGFHGVQGSFPDLYDEFFLKLVREGGSLGIFLIATCNTSTGMGFKISGNIKHNFALQMIDRSDYMSIVGRTNGLEPDKKPGRGLCKSTNVYEYQTALAVDAVSEGERIKKLRELCVSLSNGWTGYVPRVIPIMPDIITQTDLKCNADIVEIGLGYKTIAPVQIEFARTWYMAISGTPKSGKTNMLHLMLNGFLVSSDIEIVVYEPRDKSFISLADRIKHINAADDFDAFMASMIPILQDRKKRYSAGERGFNRIVILIDDYEVCFEKADDQTITRLTQITKLAEGLNVHLYVAGKPNVFIQGDSLSENLKDAPYAIALGGDLIGHPNFKSDLSNSDKLEKMGSYEGYLFVQGRAEKFKSALAKKG